MKIRYWISLFLVIVVTAGGVVAQDNGCDLDNAGALAGRGDNHADAGDYELAVRDYTCALALSPDNVDYLNRRGIAYQDMGEPAKALEDYNRALEIDPEYAYVYNNRGNIAYEQGDYETAIPDYTRSLELGNDQPEIPYYNRGKAYYELGDYEKALTDLTRSIGADNTYEGAYLSRAWTYLTLNDARAYPDFARWLDLIVTDQQTYALDSSVDSERFPMTEGRVYRFTFEAQAGQKISAEATSASGVDVDPLLVLLDPAGTAITADDDSGLNLDAVIRDFVIPETGTYTLMLGHAGGGETGDGDIALSLDLGGAVTATFDTYKLFVGEMAEVFTTGRTVLNLREGPGLDYQVIAKLNPGNLVTLVEGPHKADGYAWWKVRTQDNVAGWAVERVENEQTLILALIVGKEAVVTTGADVLNVRKEAGKNAELAFQLVDSTHVTLLEAPTTLEGFRWWKIRTADDQEGWAVDRFGGERMLTPAREFE